MRLPSADLPVTTVWIGYDPLFGASTKRTYYCNFCGTPVARYTGLVFSIVPGEAPNVLPLSVRCRNTKCQACYSFQHMVPYVPDGHWP